MADDGLDRALALLRNPSIELVNISGTAPTSETRRNHLRYIADYLDQHARTAPETEEGVHLISEAEAQSIRDTAKHLEYAFGIVPEVSEPSREELIEALTVIGEFGGKTLIMATDDPHERSAYSLGAHRAFEQTANIARSVLSRARRA